MKIVDKVYGESDIDDTVLIELINSAAMQRLKGISQVGMPDEYYFYPGFSRFEHSVGVMLLLRRLGTSLEEQIVGLLHDVSHTAFSHVIDWVVSDGSSEDFQDDHHEEYIENSGLPEILKKHGFKLERITDYRLFGLLERNIPNLCADRVDYSLREMPSEVTAQLLPAIISKDNLIVFSNQASARMFADKFLKLQATIWGGFESVSRYIVLAYTLKRAFQKGILSLEDVWRQDQELIDELSASNDEKILACLDLLRNKSIDWAPKSSKVSHRKFRYVDPHYLVDSKPVRLSEADEEFKEKLEEHRLENKKGLHAVDIKKYFDSLK